MRASAHIALLLMALGGGAVQAARPLQTDDAGVLAAAACEIEAYAARLSSGDAPQRERSVQLGCGIGFESQIALALSGLNDGSERLRGLNLAGKTALWQGDGAEGDAPALALAWGWSGAASRGRAWRHAGAEVALLHSRPLPAGFTLHGNLGHRHDALVHHRSTSWGLAFEHAGTGTLAPMVELFGDDREAPWWNLGLRWAVLPERWTLDLSLGQQVRGGRPRLWGVGATVAF